MIGRTSETLLFDYKTLLNFEEETFGSSCTWGPGCTDDALELESLLFSAV